MGPPTRARTGVHWRIWRTPPSAPRVLSAVQTSASRRSPRSRQSRSPNDMPSPRSQRRAAHSASPRAGLALHEWLPTATLQPEKPLPTDPKTQVNAITPPTTKPPPQPATTYAESLRKNGARLLSKLQQQRVRHLLLRNGVAMARWRATVSDKKANREHMITPRTTPIHERAQAEEDWLTVAANNVLITRLDKTELSGPVLARAQGSLVWDVHGKEYLDFNSGQMCSALGHSHPRIVAAIKEAAGEFIHASSSFFNTQELELAEKLAGFLPDNLNRCLFLESGSDANEVAIQIAKRYTGRYEVASPHIGFHGLSDASRAVTFGTGWNKGYGPYAPGAYAFMGPYCFRCPIRLRFPECQMVCVDGATQVLDSQVEGGLAAIITEPLFSAGGVIEPPPGWLAAVRAAADERGALLILDEAQTGLGKLGDMWGFERDGVVPDIVTISKHFGGGISISAIVTTDEIADAVQATGFTHGHSHTSDPLACAAASATLDVIREEDLPTKAKEIGNSLRRRLVEVQQSHPSIADLRGRGLIQGLEFSDSPSMGVPPPGYRVEAAAVSLGLLMSVRRGGSVLRFVPPWSTTEEQLDRATSMLDDALTTCGL